jgi:hypothetical protein
VFDSRQSLDQCRTHHFKLAAVVGRQLVEQPGAPGCDPQQDTAGIGFVAGPLEQAFFHGSVCELDHAIVPQTETLSRVGNGGRYAGGRTGNLQQQLVLLGLQPSRVGRLLTELHEAAKAITKFCQALDQCVRGSFSLSHIYIVSRYISFWMPMRVALALVC